MAQIFTNYARSRLASGIDDTQTTITVTTGDGALFPFPSGGDYALVTVEDPITRFTEIMRLTGRSGDTLTVVRGQENTNGSAFSVDARVEVRVTAGTLDNLVQQGELTQAVSDLESYADQSEADAVTAANAYTDQEAAQAEADAVTAANAYTDGRTAADFGALPTAGGTMTGDIEFSNGVNLTVRNVRDPIANNEAANKRYVDDLVLDHPAWNFNRQHLSGAVEGTVSSWSALTMYNYDAPYSFNYGVSLDIVNGRVVILKEGVYRISVSLGAAANNASTFWVGIRKNGSVWLSVGGAESATNFPMTTVDCATLVRLSASDYLEFMRFNQGVLTVNDRHHTYFTGEFIRPL